MKVFGLCTTETGEPILEYVHRNIPLSGIFGLTQRDTGDAISGFKCMNSICENWKIPFFPIESYSLQNERDRKIFDQTEIDVLLVMGWQRLVPEWLIKKCRLGVIGAHGSPMGISAGRGRSPQTWSLLLGAEEFSVSIFLIDNGIDSGDVIDTRIFKYNSEDDIRSSYWKSAIAIAEMTVAALSSGEIKRAQTIPQDGESFYLPQRLPEDGFIDWNTSAIEVCRFVRALTSPYPGAWTSTQDDSVMRIWRARPFEFKPTDRLPGSIVAVFPPHGFVVSVRDGTVVVDASDRKDGGNIFDLIQTNKVLKSVPISEQLGKIVERHRKKYPDLPVAPMILKRISGP